MSKLILSFLVFSCFVHTIRAQSLSPTVVASGGDYFANASGSLSWTLGECVTTYVGTNYTLSQGFQQAYSVVTAIEQPMAGDDNILVYPNPATDKIHIQIDNAKQGEYRLYLMDMLGRVQLNTKLNGMGIINNDVDMQHLSKGMYFLHIYSGDKEIRTTKIEHL